MLNDLLVSLSSRYFRDLRRARRGLLVALCLPALVFAEYKIPSVDDREASAPAVSGHIADISGNILIVQSQGEEISVLTAFDTHIFTGYGGIVRLDEVCRHSRIDVWYATPDANFRISTAASIRVPETC